MADRRKRPSDAKKPDRTAKLIHDLATDPPPKDIASVKAASDVFEARKKTGKTDGEPKKSARRH